MTRRILFAILLLAAPFSLYAQNDFGIWVNETNFKSTTFFDPEGDAKLKFSQKVGFGVSFNHFSGPNMSTEFAWQQLRAKAKVSVSGLNGTFDVGDVKANQLTAIVKWHFIPRSFIVPYVGAGAAYHTGAELHASGDITGGDSETVDFGNKFGYVLNGGVNFGVTPRMSIGLDLKYAPFKAHEKGTDSSEDVKLDPTTIALGVRFRM